MSDQSNSREIYRDHVDLAVLLGPATHFQNMQIEELKSLAYNEMIWKFLQIHNFLEIASSDMWKKSQCRPQSTSLDPYFAMFCESYPEYCQQDRSAFDFDNYADDEFVELKRKGIFTAHVNQGTSLKNLFHLA